MDQVEALYNTVVYLDIEKMKKLLASGSSPNAMRTYTPANGFRNLAMEVLDIDWSYERLDMVDTLLDSGLDINHEDDEGHTIVMYIIDLLKEDDFSHIDDNLQNPVERLRETYDKAMQKGPESVSGLFEFARKMNRLYWFEPYVDYMTEEDQESFKDYRLVRLFE